VTADGRQARVHEERVRHGVLHLLPQHGFDVEESDRPLAHAHRATVHDRFGHGRHGAGDEAPADAQERRFLDRVAQALDAAAEAHLFERLVLMASPRPLGMLRAALKPSTARLIEVADHHDRMDGSAEDLREQLRAARASG
jgi:hypothetical protein